MALRQDSSFGPKLYTGEALVILGAPAAAIQLTQKEPHPRPTAGVRPAAANPGDGTAPGLWPRLWHITGVSPGRSYPSYVPSPGYPADRPPGGPPAPEPAATAITAAHYATVPVEDLKLTPR